ncbi:MAG: hypothetical protein N2439_11340, partial [Anaerolineae bacterium]|nr:hypothetical protein [Anaerolineae bacterium]
VSEVLASTIAGQLDAGTNVSISTVAAGGAPGDITVGAAISRTASNGASLALNAHRDILVNNNITLPNATAPGENAKVTLNAGRDVQINNATVQAGALFVTAGGSIQRSGSQANDFVYGRAWPDGGTLQMFANGGAIGAAGNPLRFFNNLHTSSYWWRAQTTAASGDIYLRNSNTDLRLATGTNFTTAAGSSQKVVIEHTGSGSVDMYDNISGNDHWTIQTAGSFRSCNFGGCAGGHYRLTANSITVNAAHDIGASGSFSPGVLFDTSAVNGSIHLTAGTFDGNGCGGGNYGIGLRPGTGTVTAVSTGAPNCSNSGSIQLIHHGGDLLTSRYNLSFTGGNADNRVRLWAADGHIIIDSTFDSSLNNRALELRTLAAGRDIRFAGGTITGNRTEFFATGNIDNLAPGTLSFEHTSHTVDRRWGLHAGGGIGLTNPIEYRANWVGSVRSGGVGSAGDIRLNCVACTGNRFYDIRTDTGSAQTISIAGSNAIFSIDSGSAVTDNDAFNINVSGNVHFDSWAGIPA